MNDLICILMAAGTFSIGFFSGMFEHKIHEIINKHIGTSITSERIAEIANEPTPCSTYVSATKYRIEKALREAGVRVG